MSVFVKHGFWVLLLTLISCSPQPEADLIIYNAGVITLDDARPTARAVAVSGDRIAAVGSDSLILTYRTAKTELIDAGGQTLIPGFIEGHAHFMGLGQALLTIDLRAAQSWPEIVALVDSAVQKSDPGTWIFGRGWHQEKWLRPPVPHVQGYPLHTSLSAVSPDNPVVLSHASGHGIMANQKAMALAGVNRETATPDGGVILRDASGQPTGIFLENAEALILQAYRRRQGELPADARRAMRLKMLRAATAHSLKNGITGFHDAGASFDDIDFFRQAARSGELKTRLWVMIAPNERLTPDKLKRYRMVGAENNMLTVRAIKQYADGALGSRGAWMLQPYSDRPGTSGQNTTPMDSILKVARLAYEADYQVCTHAIGDRGNREVLDIYEQVLRGDISRRWRIEHAQHLAVADIPRFADLGVIASVQTVHCTSDGLWVPARIGEERAREGAYVWQKLLKSGARLANGTDAPVERLSPLKNYYAAVTRRLSDGSVFFGDQKLTREEALKSLTLWNAYAAFEEKEKGSITAGKLADFTLLSANPLTVPEEKIPAIRVLMTVLGGSVEYKAPGQN